MAKFELKFICINDPSCNIKCQLINGKIDITLEECGITNTINLDKSTAIKLAKTLRTEINKIED
jgi:hypothetical protein